MTKQQAIDVLAALWPLSYQQLIEQYAEIVRTDRKYSPLSWLQCVGWIAAGGNPVHALKRLSKLG